jgi:hypothetical protein
MASAATDMPISSKSATNDISNTTCTLFYNSSINCNNANNSISTYEQLDTTNNEPNTAYDTCIINSNNVSRTSNDEYLELIATSDEYLEVSETTSAQVQIDALAATCSWRALPQTTTDAQRPSLSCSAKTRPPAAPFKNSNMDANAVCEED